jgi:putative ABC transport system permease protein
MKWLWFAVQNVRRNRRRSLITILIAAVGTTALLVCGGYAQYTYSALQEAAARDSGHLILAHGDYFEKDEELPMQLGLGDSGAARVRLEALPEVLAALPRLQFSGLLSNGEKSSVFIGTGIDPSGELQARGSYLSLTGGAMLAALPPADDLPEILLGKDLARQLRATPGTTLTLLATTTEGSLNAQDVRVKGIFSTGAPELDKRAVQVHLATAQRLLLTDRVSTLSIYLRNLAATDGQRQVVAGLFPSRALQTWRDQAFYYRAVRALYDRIFGLLGAIIVVIVLFSVSNTLGMAVVERTREIGTFRALGAFPSQITRNFVLEGMVVGLAGALAGAVAAVLLSRMVELAGVQMPPPPGRSVGYPLHIVLTVPLCGVATLVIVAASAAAAWLVSRKAAARPVVEALAHV